MAAASTPMADMQKLDSPCVDVPLHVDADGTVRVAGTRVTLETVVETFDGGASPEEIGRAFPVLNVRDVYAVIAYYLANQDTVRAYVRGHEEAAAAVQREIEAKMARRGAQLRPRADSVVGASSPEH